MNRYQLYPPLFAIDSSLGLVRGIKGGQNQKSGSRRLVEDFGAIRSTRKTIKPILLRLTIEGWLVIFSHKGRFAMLYELEP